MMRIQNKHRRFIATTTTTTRQTVCLYASLFQRRLLTLFPSRAGGIKKQSSEQRQGRAATTHAASLHEGLFLGNYHSTICESEREKRRGRCDHNNDNKK